MKFYLVARYGRREELFGYAKQLRENGHEVVSSWINGENEALDGSASVEEQGNWAIQDLHELHHADMVLVFTEGPHSGHSRGGRHVELGAAIAMDKSIAIVGCRENTFCCLPTIKRYDSFARFMTVGLS